jgi:uncharacterized protein
MSSPDTQAPPFAGTFELTAPAVRVLGCLLEKQRTTPDAYPLSLNALRLACNQSTNRYPVVNYDDALIRDALHRLERRGMTRLASGRGSRTPKYRHLLAEALPMDSAEQAILCVLMLRAAQTPGELKQRTERMHTFAGLDAVNQTLERMTARGLAERLPRRPGQKEERYRHLLGGASEKHAEGVSTARGGPPAEVGLDRRPAPDGDPAPDRGSARGGGVARDAGSGSGSGGQRDAGSEVAPLDSLHERVARLERQVAELSASMRTFSSQYR